MRRATRNGVFAVVAASGAMAVAMPVTAAFAADGASADGAAAGSPGAVSGNTIQLPVHVPVNVCGDTVNVVGLLNPSFGNRCANGGGSGTAGSATSGSVSKGGSSAHGTAADSAGAVSGNGVQLPVHLPVNVSGNSVDVVGVLNPVFGNQSVNNPVEQPTPPTTATPTPPTRKPPVPTRSHPVPHTPEHVTPPAPRPSVETLAHTGADLTAPAVAGSAALVLTGAALYRRFGPRRTR
ncbi:chaplin [Streptomyces sp. IBSBF 3136]|uniref:chaplin n=1 Tax=Streptomyces sp. IBSBF 3136 TaxID=2903524 RepID=UPI003FA72712